MTEKEKLEIIREQLKTMRDFMAATDDGIWYHDELWWAGDVPDEPELYLPEDWQQGYRPIYIVWEEYLAELERARLANYRKQAEELEIGRRRRGYEQNECTVHTKV